MLLKQKYYDRINEEFPKIKDQFEMINYLNQYVESLSRIICNGFTFVDPKIDVYRFNQEYLPLSNNDTFEIVANTFKNIDDDLYNSYMNILYDSELTKIIHGTNPSFVYGEGLFLNLKNTTLDITEITHESIHRIYNSVVSETSTFKEIFKLLFSEVNSITFESIVNENLKIDKDKYLEERIYSDMSKAIYYVYVMTVFKTYQKYGVVDNEKLNNELNLINDDNIKQAINSNLLVLANVSSKRINYLTIDLLKYSKYIIASVISKTLYARLKDGTLTYQKYLKDMLELNKIDSYEQALDILDVNYIYHSEKLKELNENYINTCRKICETRNR